MPGRFWKWRNCSSGIHMTNSLPEEAKNCSLIFASDFLNLPDFLALNRSWLGSKPIVLYMHENQVTYPDHESGTMDRAYPLLNVSCCAAADHILFNSHFHRNSFLKELPGFIKACPDFRPAYLAGEIEKKSSVITPGISGEDGAAPEKEAQLVLWNHRWEHDKNPSVFFEALFALKKKGIPFRLAVAGKHYKKFPEIFKEAQTRLSKELVHFGYIEQESVYREMVARAGIIVSSALHDFFGLSVAETILAGARPVLPNRLNYPWLVPAPYHERCLYDEDSRLQQALEKALTEPWTESDRKMLQTYARQFTWKQVAGQFDDFFESISTV